MAKVLHREYAISQSELEQKRVNPVERAEKFVTAGKRGKKSWLQARENVTRDRRGRKRMT